MSVGTAAEFHVSEVNLTELTQRIPLAQTSTFEVNVPFPELCKQGHESYCHLIIGTPGKRGRLVKGGANDQPPSAYSL